MASKEEEKKESLSKKKKSVYRVHGNKGVYCGGEWIPIEECADWLCPKQCTNPTKSSTDNITEVDDENIMYDVAIIGAGCIGTSIARELSRYTLKTILLERDDDVTQGATKGNSGIIHAGYDDKPNTMRSKFCWNGNQMFPQLDKELKFGYLKNGSLVVARSDSEYLHLKQLYARGQKNGIKNLRIIEAEELHLMEPNLAPDCIAALYSPDAGTVTPYEFTIALAENAAMNGVQIRTRHEVVAINYSKKENEINYFNIGVKKWSYEATSDVNLIQVDAAARRMFIEPVNMMELSQVKALIPLIVSIAAVQVMFNDEETIKMKYGLIGVMLFICAGLVYGIAMKMKGNGGANNKLFSQQSCEKSAANYDEIEPNKIIRARYVVNCGGLFADVIANMIGDKSFVIKPRLGEYLLMHKDIGHLANCTLFPCPDTKVGTKGVLVQTTLWGNLILGPTARDVYKASTQKESADEIMKFLLKKSQELVPSIDPTQVIHSFAGARAKSDRGDWIIEQTQCRKDINFYNVAGIDSPGLAGSPAIAIYVVNELLCKKGKLKLIENKLFNPYRKPTIFPKKGWKGLKLKKVPKNINDLKLNLKNENELKKNVVCKCEKVTEYEIIDSLRRKGVSVDTTQAIRRRTRAGMGHCQADINNCNCELYVANIISKMKNINLNKVGRRPWPATSLLKQRWLNDNDKNQIQSLVE